MNGLTNLKRNNMKQTSIEWLYKNLLDNPLSNEDVIYNINVIEQAKEMHKQEIIDFAKSNLDRALDLDIRSAYSLVEQYYSETYNK